MKKIASLMMALVMVLAMSVTAFAANITISNANGGETYDAYLIFTATTSESGSVTYYIDSENDYYSYISNSNLFTLVGPNSEGLYQVTWIGDGNATNDGTDGHENEVDADIISFLTNLGAKGTKAGTVTPEEDGSAVITVTVAGYYFVTTTTGSVVSIDTVTTSATITDKNSEPTVEKEETTDGTAGIGDTVEFSATISAAEDVENLTYHDVMSSGLTFNSASVGVTVVTPAEVEGGEDTVASLAVETDYTVVIPNATADDYDGCTFEVVFTNAGLSKVSDGDSIVITYSATVNANAVIDGEGNSNTGSLSYGNAGTSTESKTYTKVYDVDVYKYTTVSGSTETTPLSGAEFVLYKLVDSGEVDQDKNPIYTKLYATVVEGKLTGWTETKTSATTLVSAASTGLISVDGLDAGTYYLEETKAPTGYNLLDDAVEFTIENDGTVTQGESTDVTYVGVVNQAGSSLPSTGGIGTTIFYVVGTVLVLGAAVVLITRRRMSSEA